MGNVGRSDGRCSETPSTRTTGEGVASIAASGAASSKEFR
jgi:hypothetical protein